MIVQNETGALFPLGNTEMMGALLSEFALDRRRTISMGERARKHSTKYSVEVAVHRTLRAVETVSR
jgi:hypothetical protein